MTLHPDKLHGVNMALAPKAYGRRPGLISNLAARMAAEKGPAGPAGPAGSKGPKRRPPKKPHNRHRYGYRPVTIGVKDGMRKLS